MSRFLFPVFLVCLLSATMAAAPLSFTFTGTTAEGTPVLLSFTAEGEPSPGQIAPEFFVIENVPVFLSIGSTESTDLASIGFYVAAPGGGFDVFGGTAIIASQGPQLFTGTTSDPAMVPGTYDLETAAAILNGSPTEITASQLVISDVPLTPVPEPAPSGVVTAAAAFLLCITRSRQSR